MLGVEVDSLAPLDVASAAAASKHRDKVTVEKDVGRSLWRFAEVAEWSGKVRKKRRSCLKRVLNATFDEETFYYQGFHDVAELVLLACGFERERFAVALCRSLARRHLRDATRSGFENVSLSLRLLVPLIFAADAELGKALFVAPEDDEGSWALLLEPLWALPWVDLRRPVEERETLVRRTRARRPTRERPTLR